MQTAVSFEFTRYDASSPDGKIFFVYTVVFEDGSKQVFTEILQLPNNAVTISVERKESALGYMLQALHLILGISYYKLYCPKEIKVGSYALTKSQAEFWNTIYTKGLGEFFYKNNIDFRGLINFPYDDSRKILRHPDPALREKDLL